MASLDFKGKTLVQNYHLTVKYHELVPKKDKSLSDKVRLDDNLIIHGDNLKALKALLPTYAGKVKCIYIDPPYNTGNEGWAYNDNVNSPMMQEWFGKAVDRDDLTRHDKWLCMMMPRLKLLKELLRNDGAIFVSVDDNEIHNLRALMDEVFGESNFVSSIAVKANPRGRQSDEFVATLHEYCVCYGRNRDHSYRQVLDIASGGRTVIYEKTDRFTPEDIAENLVVLTLMLPSASRQNKETLKVFKDSGGFSAFFPKDDDVQGHAKLLERFANLDAFGDGKGLFQRQVKTSLGNTLRILSPIVILDEGHKAYSEMAQDTLRGLNPSVIVELSATPTDDSNVLVDIKGLELKREEMIKLDLHINNKESTRWKDTMLASIKKREALEAAARKYEANTGNYIRPICLVQVERTGKDQRGGNFIHAEDVRDFLVKEYGVTADEVAVKSSEKDDIEGLNLFARNCPIRYIITKQALQEGWDCAFAYVLAILTNPASKNNLTQLIGRILRQPGARKTKLKELDESYVFCFRQKAKLLVDAVREGFGREGLGDLAGQVVMDSPDGDEQGEELIELRDQFKKFAGKIYLPKFVIQQGKQWREVSYETDIVSRIDWAQADFSAERNLQLADADSQDAEIIVTLGGTKAELIKEQSRKYRTSEDAGVDPVFATRQMLEMIPNPWIAHDVVKDVIATLTSKNGLDLVAKNFVFIVQELVKRAESERNRLAQDVFTDLISAKKLRFLLLKDDVGYRLPSKISMRHGTRKLVREDNSPLQMSLFEQVAEDGLNSDEQSVAWYFEKQAQLLWWYRNLSRQDYRLQGWRKNGIYPDFIVSRASALDKTDFDKVFVVESKGIHLKNDDTDYKKQVFKLCNKLAEEKSWTELGLEFPERRIVFELIYGDEWQKVLNRLLK